MLIYVGAAAGWAISLFLMDLKRRENVSNQLSMVKYAQVMTVMKTCICQNEQGLVL